jgi:hypothetical protein
MTDSEKKARDKRILKEVKRLKNIFKDIEDERKILIEGLIKRASYMRITLEDYETDILENGSTEMFSQSEKTDPYERERPVARLYNTMNKNYQTMINQLSKLLPETKSNGGEIDDGFEAFVTAK